jgi:hypothetical protein
MDDTTTTDSQSAEASEETSQLEQAIDTTAEVAADETQTDTGSDSVPQETDEDLAWLKNKGLDPTDPEFAKKAAQLARNTEREFHKTRQDAKSQLQEAATNSYTEDEYADPTAQRLQVVETRLAVQDFYTANPDAKDMDADMAKIVQAKPYLAGDLEAVYAIAKAGKYEADLKAAETKGRNAAKAEIARTSGAALPTGNASDSTPAPALTRQAIANMTAAEYASRREEIFAAQQAGKLN